MSKSTNHIRRYVGPSAVAIAAARFGLLDSWFTLVDDRSFAKYKAAHDFMRRLAQRRSPTRPDATRQVSLSAPKVMNINGE
jgi:hypothetical protein